MALPATTPMSILLNYSKIHVELSSKCTLKCPRCPRTEMHPDSLNRDISITTFQKAFSPALLQDVEEILFCGDIGDPIYARDFLPIVEYIRQTSGTRISIVTNGSYKDPEWWQQLGAMLARQDEVTFSVDGWDQASNNQYRVNSNFDSIIKGAQALRASSQCLMIWSTIYFNFNEKHIQSIQDQARSIGFDQFRMVKSSKFNGRYLVDGLDPLIPETQNVANTAQYEVTISPLVVRGLPTIPIVPNQNRHEWAKCMRWEKEMFVNVDGLVFPCPWFNNAYMENDFVEKYRAHININTRTLTEILEDPLWDELYTRFAVAPLEICRYKCRDCK